MADGFQLAEDWRWRKGIPTSNGLGQIQEVELYGQVVILGISVVRHRSALPPCCKHGKRPEMHDQTVRSQEEDSPPGGHKLGWGCGGLSVGSCLNLKEPHQ